MLDRPGHGAEQPLHWPRLDAAALAEEASRGCLLGHNLFIPSSQASCVVREYADDGHGAVGEPLAVHTAMVQLECYSCAEVGFSLDLGVRERSEKSMTVFEYGH